MQFQVPKTYWKFASSKASKALYRLLSYRLTGPLIIAAPENVSEIVTADLRGSGRFAPLAATDLPSRPVKFSDVNFKDWRLLGMDNLLIGQIEQVSPDQFSIEFRLIDIYQQKQVVGFRIPTNASGLRQAAHHIIDIVYEEILKTKGAFATRIAYITVDKSRDSADKLTQVYRLQVADSDGYNARTILKSNEPLLSPAWSPQGDPDRVRVV